MTDDLRTTYARIIRDVAVEASDFGLQRKFTYKDWDLMIERAIDKIVAVTPSAPGREL